MKSIAGKVCVGAVLLLFHAGSDASAQTAGTRASLTLPVTGTFANNGVFTGTIAVNRFETRGDQIVAIAFITGTLTHRNRLLGTGLVGEVVVPVTVRAGAVTAVKTRPSADQRLRTVAFSASPRRAGLELTQAAACPVVDVVLGPFTANVLGVDVLIPPVEIHLSGEEGNALGALVCEASELIGNVAGLVGVVNSILNLLIMLLGGTLGGF